MSKTPTLPAPKTIRDRVDRLFWERERLQKRAIQIASQLKELDAGLAIADDVSEALEDLSGQMFDRVLGLIESKLTLAVQEVLNQPVVFKTEASFRAGTTAVTFSMERDGNAEDILRGQGGSVQNILSVGLRLFALAQLNESEHRRFLVLDEQDCWLRPELVPKLVKIVHEAAKQLEFQVIMISHHDLGLFRDYADKVYRLSPGPEGIQIEDTNPPPVE